jgi:hypothetical protein
MFDGVSPLIPQENEIVSDIRPRSGNRTHVALAVHVRSMEDQDRGPFLG